MPSPSLPVVMPNPRSSLIRLPTWKNGNVGVVVWRWVTPEGFVTFVWRWHLGEPAGPHSGQPMSPVALPWRGTGLSGISHSHHSPSCLGVDLYSSFQLNWTLHCQDWHVYRLSLFWFCELKWNHFLFWWWNLSTLTQKLHSPDMSQPNKGSISAAHLGTEIKNWKTLLMHVFCFFFLVQIFHQMHIYILHQNSFWSRSL